MTLEQIKNDFAYSYGFENWEELFLASEQCFESFEYYENEVMKIYARECLNEASLNICAEINYSQEIKELIINENNIIK